MTGRWPNFDLDEFTCHCGCGGNKMADSFLDRLQALRTRAGYPFIILSGYRCPRHNDKVSTTGIAGPHTTGHASDLLVSRKRALLLIPEAVALGFTGIGVQQKGATRFLHLDDLADSPGSPRPTLWSY